MRSLAAKRARARRVLAEARREAGGLYGVAYAHALADVLTAANAVPGDVEIVMLGEDSAKPLHRLYSKLRAQLNGSGETSWRDYGIIARRWGFIVETPREIYALIEPDAGTRATESDTLPDVALADCLGGLMIAPPTEDAHDSSRFG